MKKGISLLLLFICLVSLASFLLKRDLFKEKIQVDHYEVKAHQAEVLEGDFILRLKSSKPIYQQGEEIEVYAELTYLGDDPEIEVHSSASILYFRLKEFEREIELEEAILEIGLTSKLRAKQSHRKSFNYVGEARDSFHKQIRENRYPVGYYQIDAVADFTVFESDPDQPKHYAISARIDFKVIDGDEVQEAR